MKALFMIALAAVAVVLAGCETESSDNISISISPNHATLAEGESQTFTASGWRDYTWSLSNAGTYCVISNTKGDSTVLTVINGNSSTNETVTQALTLTANIPAGDATDSTSISNSSLVSAQAFITIEYEP